MQIVKRDVPIPRQSSEQNRLLAALSPEIYERLLPHLKLVPLPVGVVLHEPGDVQEFVYFPIDCVVSFIYVMKDGSTTEIAVVGREGLVGTSVVFRTGGGAPSRALVSSGGKGYRLSAKVLEDEFERGGELQHLLLCFTQARITQTAQTVVCNRHHAVEQQLCRWLLLNLDRLPSRKLAMSQELIANMLGVRRESVTEAAGHLQAAGMIQYSRGTITVLDRLQLEKKVCECYAVVKKEYDRLLPVAPSRSPQLRPARWYPAAA